MSSGQDILDLAYYSGWRKNEILGLTWEEIDMAGGVIRLSPARSKTLVGRILPISQPIAEALARRRARRDPDSPLVFHRDGIPVRRWRTAWRTACQSAGVSTRFGVGAQIEIDRQNPNRWCLTDQWRTSSGACAGRC